MPMDELVKIIFISVLVEDCVSLFARYTALQQSSHPIRIKRVSVSVRQRPKCTADYAILNFGMEKTGHAHP